MAPSVLQGALDVGSGGTDLKNAFEKLVSDFSSILGPSSGLDSNDVDVQKLHSLMEHYISNKNDWSKYMFTDFSRGYTRNLVDEGNGKSNLLLLVWTPGKGSPIHDHADAHCLMRILQGTLRETRYEFPIETAPMIIKKETTYHEGQATYMADELGLHKITNPDPQVVAVSLHQPKTRSINRFTSQESSSKPSQHINMNLKPAASDGSSTSTNSSDQTVPTGSSMLNGQTIPAVAKALPPIIPPLPNHGGASSSSSSSSSSSASKGKQPEIAKLMSHEDKERMTFCRRFDEAQPCGKTLSVNDPEFKRLMREFRRKKQNGDEGPPEVVHGHNKKGFEFQFWKKQQMNRKGKGVEMSGGNDGGSDEGNGKTGEGKSTGINTGTLFKSWGWKKA
ncbi:hypothetical protein B7463_g2432, partial [Scytalidium lignicola]